MHLTDKTSLGNKLWPMLHQATLLLFLIESKNLFMAYHNKKHVSSCMMYKMISNHSFHGG